MRKVIGIVAAGIAAGAVLIYFGRSTETTSAPASKLQHPRTPAQHSAASTDVGTERAAATSERSRAVDELTDEQKLAACAAMWTRQAERNQAKLAAEPKDPAWAYPMEQKLREYTSRKFQSSQIDVVAIDCRTYYCQIRAQGFVPEKTSKEFAEAMSALQAESPGDFSGTGIWHEEEADKTFHIARLDRPQPRPRAVRVDPIEARLQSDCAALQSKQQEQRRATLDAQERDAGWAEPMEYRLREFMTAQLSKHPADHLDIDCRTTFCRVQASGRTSESEAAFKKASAEAAEQSWANLWLAEEAGTREGQNWDADIKLYRRRQ
jgi:hypothetical protein